MMPRTGTFLCYRMSTLCTTILHIHPAPLDVGFSLCIRSGKQAIRACLVRGRVDFRGPEIGFP